MMKGDPILHPPLNSESVTKPPIPLQAVIERLAELLRTVPSDQREVIASVMGAFGRNPLPELGMALVALLENRLGENN